MTTTTTYTELPELTRIDLDEVILEAGGNPDESDPLRRAADSDPAWLLRRVLSSARQRGPWHAAINVATPPQFAHVAHRETDLAVWEILFSWVAPGTYKDRFAWAIVGSADVWVDGYGMTRIGVADDVAVTVVERDGTASHITGRSLAVYVGRALRDALADAKARELVGEPVRIGQTPVQTESAWSPERFAAWVSTRRKGDFDGREEFVQLKGLPGYSVGCYEY